MNYVKVSVILAEIINFILLLIEVGVQQRTLGLKAHGELIRFLSGVLWQYFVWKQDAWLVVKLINASCSNINLICMNCNSL